MWGWNMRTVFYDVSRGKYVTETPLNSVGTYFDEAMQIAGAKDAQAEESETLRNAQDVLQNVVATAATSVEEKASTSTLDTLAESLATHVSSTTSTDNTTTTP